MYNLHDTEQGASLWMSFLSYNMAQTQEVVEYMRYYV